jgi:putative membrane protein
MRIRHFIKQFNWRFLLVRIVVNALALAFTAAVTPKIYFVDRSIGSWLLMALMLGILNALLKPVLQFLTLQFIFVTYGLVVVLVNALLLWSLSLLFPNRFAVDNLLWALLGGLVLGLVSSFLESLLGLTMPIVSDEPPELRHQLEEQARHAEWLKTAGSEAMFPEPQQEVAMEGPSPEPGAAAPAMAERSASGPDEAASPPTEDRAEPPDSTAMGPAGAEDPALGPDEDSSPLVQEDEQPSGSVTPIDPYVAPEEAADEQEEGQS